jgi:hypothetical protein
MWKLIVLAVALGQQHGPEFKAGWQRAKARADLLDRYRHGLIDTTTLASEQLKLATPQEEAAFWKGFRERMRAYDERTKLQEEALGLLKNPFKEKMTPKERERLRQITEQLRETGRVPRPAPKPPDMK